MKILILGWYGTETIGDRAILAGILYLFNNEYENIEIKLGSLNPFFSKRTINEDKNLYYRILNKHIKIEIFDSTKINELESNIKSVNIVIMGGGPLMDIDELYMIEYAFKFSKLYNKKTALVGCGIGPLFKDVYKKSVLNICNYSDIIILRDQISKIVLNEISNSLDTPLDLSKIKVALDPSFVILNKNLYDSYILNEEPYIAINLRSFPSEYTDTNLQFNINKAMKDFVNTIAMKNNTYKIKLIPMHYFYIGNDDREILNYIAMKINQPNVIVQNKNLTLEETILTYKNASYNIGMRYHSIVFQTLISGKNYILDYTKPDIGKISGFLRDIDQKKFYANRYVNLQINDLDLFNIQFNENTFNLEDKIINDSYKIYFSEIKKLS